MRAYAATMPATPIARGGNPGLLARAAPAYLVTFYDPL